MNKKEIYFSLVLLFSIITFIVNLKLSSSLNLYGDTAMNYTILENAQKEGFLFNPIFPSLMKYSFIDSVYTQPLAFFNNNNFNFEDSIYSQAVNHLRFHFYAIIFLLAPLVKMFSAKIIVNTLNISSFFGLLFLGYCLLRNQRIPIFLSLLSVLAFSFNLAWSQSLFHQPFYDRLFMVMSFAFVLTCVKKNFSPIYFILALLISSMTVEKALIYNAIFLFSYVVANFQKIDQVRLKYFLGAAFFCFFIFLLVSRLYLNNPYYQSAIPHSLSDLFYRITEILTIEDQKNRTFTFLLEVSPLLILPLFFAFRFFLIAFIILIPNIIGNIGGAEKIGFSTHYHSLYLGFLCFAYLLAINNLYKSNIKFKRIFIFLYLMLTILFYLFFSINNKNLIEFKFSNLNYVNQIADFYKSRGSAQKNQDLINNLIPKESRLSVSETAMAYVYDFKNLSFFPYNYENSDFLIVQYSVVQGKNLPYFMTLLGEDHNIKSRLAIYNRLVDAGFNPEKPLAISPDFMIIGKEL
jgi:hypothetical protein